MKLLNIDALGSLFCPQLFYVLKLMHHVTMRYDLYEKSHNPEQL